MLKGLLNQRTVRLFAWSKILNPQQLRSVIFDQILVPKEQPVQPQVPISTNKSNKKQKTQRNDEDDDENDDNDFLQPKNLSEQANFFIQIKSYDLELMKTLDLLIELNAVPVPRTMSQDYRQYISFIQTIWEKLRLIKREYFDEIVQKKSFRSDSKKPEAVLERESKELLAKVAYELLKNIAKVINKDKSRSSKILEKARSLSCFFISNYFEYLTIDERAEVFQLLNSSLDDSVRYYFLFLGKLKKSFNSLGRSQVTKILFNLTPSRFTFLFKKDIQYSIFSSVKMTPAKEFEALVSALFTLYSEMITDTQLDPDSFAQILFNVYNCESNN